MSPLDIIQGHLVDLFPVHKNVTELQFWILSNISSMYGHGKYGNANHTLIMHGFLILALVDMKFIVSYQAKP